MWHPKQPVYPKQHPFCLSLGSHSAVWHAKHSKQHIIWPLYPERSPVFFLLVPLISVLSAAVKHGVTSCSLISTHALLGVLAVRAGSCSGLYVLLQWERHKLEICVGECHADFSEKPALIPWESYKVATCVGECHAVSSEKPAEVPWERYKVETCVGGCHAHSSEKPALIP